MIKTNNQFLNVIAMFNFQFINTLFFEIVFKKILLSYKKCVLYLFLDI